MLIDTHAHLHFSEEIDEKTGEKTQLGYSDVADVIARANDAGVGRIINIGVTPEDSRAALKLSANRDFSVLKTGVKLYATAGLHPHEAFMGDKALDEIHDLAEDVIAIGECGLDYFKNHSSKEDQEHALRQQIEIALEHNLPLVFHVRDAWDDFFKILKEYPDARGVVHSFTGHPQEVDKILAHSGELYFGLNGIMTFTKDDSQIEAAKLIPDNRLLLETDSPFLAPAPKRGRRNEPAEVTLVAGFLAELRGQGVESLASSTTANAIRLFELE